MNAKAQPGGHQGWQHPFYLSGLISPAVHLYSPYFAFVLITQKTDCVTSNVFSERLEAFRDSLNLLCY